MDIKVDVYDGSGSRIGQPLRNCISVNIQRRLDGVGDLRLAFPAADKRAAEYLTYKRRVRIFVDDGTLMREIGSGIINSDDLNEQGNSLSLSYSGTDLLDELKYRSTLTNLRYDQQGLSTVASNLIALVPGWTSTCSIVNPITARFDGVPILKALQTVATKLTGQHMRLKQWGEVEIGAFGDDISLRLIKPARITSTMRKNDTVAFIDSIKITGRSESIANRLYVYGAGQSLDTALTLEQAISTRSIALGYDYDIGYVERNGRTHWYIQDSTSISDYGLIEKFVSYREIAPLTPSATDVTAAAAALYDAAVEDLKRMKDPQIVYSVAIRKIKKDILPGDKVHLVYEDPIERAYELGGGIQPPRSIKDLFTVLTVKESFDGTHHAALEISNIDQYPETLAKKIFNSIEDMKIYADQIQPSITAYPYGETMYIDSAGSASEKTGTIQFPVQNFAYKVDRVQMRVRTDLFQAFSKGAAAGGDHDHELGTVGPTTAASGSRVILTMNTTAASFCNMIVEDYVGANGKTLKTLSSSGTHTHTPEYGVFRDTVYPGLLTIKVNGTVIDSTDVTPVGSSSSQYDATFDITSEILNKSGGFRGIHAIEISCAEGRGRVIVNFDASIHMLPYQYVS